MLNKIKNFVKDEQGSGIVEWVMIAAVTVAAIIAVVKVVIPAITQKGDDMAKDISGVDSGI